MTGDPTARALRAVRALAADLAAERRENTALRRKVAELETEVAQLRSAAPPPPRPRAARPTSESPPPARVAGRS